MTHLNGALTRASMPRRQRTLRAAVAACAPLLVLAACHSDSTTTPRTATSLSVVSGGGQSGAVGAALNAPVVIEVKDQDGNALSGATVNVTVGTASGSVSAASLTTDASGQASVTWTLGTVAGTDTLVAQVGSLPALDVLATATPDAPASIVVLTGDDQTAAAGSALPAPITVKVVDRYGNPVPNVTVTFSDDANGTLAATTVTTDANGVASDTVTLGTAPGTDDVTASVQTADGPATVTLHETGS